MSRAQAITSAATQRMGRDAGVAERSVKGFWSQAGGASFRPYSLIAVSRAFDGASARAGLLRGSILATTAVFGGFAAALSSNLILRYADSYTKLINQLRVVSDGAADTAARFGAVDAVADRSRSSLEATAILYSRIQKAAPTRGADEVLRYVETIQKALTLGGATAQEASGAAIQFSQAIASNRLSGDEIRAVLETPLGMELAKGLGVTIGKLREMGVAGELTADVVLGGLAKISDEIDTKFAKSIRTVDQAILLVDNRFTAVIGSLSKTYGATQLFADAIVALGNNLETLVPVLANVLGLLGAVFIARNKLLAGGLAGAAGGAALGYSVGGLGGALLGGVAGGLLTARSASYDTVKDEDGNERRRSFLTAMKEQSKAAKEQITQLRSEVSRLQAEYLDSSKAANAARQAAKGNLADLAPRSAQAELERSAFRLQKLDEQKLELQERLRTSYQKLAEVDAKANGAPQIMKSDHKELEAAQKRLLGLDAEKLAVQERIRQSYAALSQITAQTTPQMTKLMEAQIASQQKIVALDEQRIGLNRELQRAQEAQAKGALLVRTGNLPPAAGRAAEKNVALLEKAVKQNATVLAREMEAVEARAVQMAAVGNASAAKAAEQRIGILQTISSEQQRLTEIDAERDKTASAARVRRAQIEATAVNRVAGAARDERLAIVRQIAVEQAKINEVDSQRTEAVGGTRAARTAAEIAGGERARTIVVETAAAQKQLRDRLAETTTQLASVARAAGLAGRAKSFLRAQVSSLVGLFGGPWGVAITGAITLMGYLGLKAAESAQKISAAQQIIQERLELAAQGGSTEASESLIERRIEELGKQQETLGSLREEILSQINRAEGWFGQKLNQFTTDGGERGPRAKAAEEIRPLIAALADGEVTLDRFKARLTAIGQAFPELKPFTDAAMQNARTMDEARRAAESLTEEIKELRLQTIQPFKIQFQIAFEGAGGFGTDGAMARRAEDASMAALKGITDVDGMKALEFDVRQSERRAKGMTAEEKAWARVNKAQEQGKFLSYETVLAAEQQIEANDKLAASLKSAGKASETLSSKLALLKVESLGAFLSEIDRQVVQQAKSFKVAAKDIEAYIAAAKTGDFSGAPSQLVQLRDAFTYQEAANAARDIVQQYGDWAQIAPLAAEKQRALDQAVQEGAITAEQAKVAYADYLGTFGQYEWIGGLASAVGDLVTSGVDGFESLAEGAMNFVKRLRDMAVEILVVEPLMKSLRAALAGGVEAGGGIGGFLGSIAKSLFTGGGLTSGSLYHGGGDVGRSTVPQRAIPTALALASPRFHSGLGQDEFSAILQRGEKVLTESVSNRTASTMAGLSARLASGGGDNSGMPDIHIHEAPGTKTEVQKGEDGSLHIIATLKGEISKDIAGNGQIGKSIQSTFQVSRRKR